MCWGLGSEEIVGGQFGGWDKGFIDWTALGGARESCMAIGWESWLTLEFFVYITVAWPYMFVNNNFLVKNKLISNESFVMIDFHQAFILYIVNILWKYCSFTGP